MLIDFVHAVRIPALGALLLGFSWACASKPDVNAASYVGEYIFTPGQTPPDDEADMVILRSDGIALKIRRSNGLPGVAIEEKPWKLTFDEPGQPDIVIGNAGHRVELSGKTVRLNVYHDLDLYYEKVR